MMNSGTKDKFLVEVSEGSPSHITEEEEELQLMGQVWA